MNLETPFVAIVLNKQLDCQYICNQIQNAINKLQTTHTINDGNMVLTISFKPVYDSTIKLILLTHETL